MVAEVLEEEEEDATADEAIALEAAAARAPTIEESWFAVGMAPATAAAPLDDVSTT